ncbi:MAG: acyl carrier protein [Bacteroidetes bacterium]|nr:acyl carrier protein [Bacteroidota bacterium]
MVDAIIKESFNAGESEIKDETRLMSFKEWDSMAHMFFITKLEETFGIELTGDEIAAMETVGDVRKIIKSKTKA